jgi:hypothetical protein
MSKQERLEYLRTELRNGDLSYEEVAELQQLGDAGEIPEDDVELREAAGLPEQPYDQTGQIIAYENGELDDEEAIELFQHLVNSGLVWQLQGSYGRTAQALIEAEKISVPAS